MDDIQHRNPVQLRDELVARLAHIEEQIAELHREREALRSDLDVTERFLGVWMRTNNVQGPVPLKQLVYPIVNDVPVPPRKPRNPPRERVVDAALRIIEQRGVPVNRSDLYEALREDGLEVFGKDPVMVLSTMLWRSQDRIVRLGNRGYWFADRPYEPASYFPETEDLIGVADTEPEDGVIEEPDDEAEVTSREG